MIGPQSTLVEIAWLVCSALDKAGFTAVLTGGSAATFYAPEAHQSDDLDFVITVSGAAAGGPVLKALGFTQKNQFYAHAQTHFTIDFPPGPLAVGDETIGEWQTSRVGSQILHVLTPTDCCRDRLASYLFWDDFSGLEQALAVALARRSEVDLALVEAWCRRERQLEKFKLFVARLA